jgi:hypothetical protein
VGQPAAKITNVGRRDRCQVRLTEMILAYWTIMVGDLPGENPFCQIYLKRLLKLLQSRNNKIILTDEQLLLNQRRT